MKSLRIQIKVNEHIFIKDPESTSLGQKIVMEGLLLIDEIGLEHFTFRKLAKRIGSTEASVYRYFENKNKILIYLVSWYWNWLEYQLVFQTNNIPSPYDRLRIAIAVLVKPIEGKPDNAPFDMQALSRIVVAESSKAYLRKEVDLHNKEGYFLSYKRLCQRVAEIIREINPQYAYSTALVSTVVEGAHLQQYFSEHLPSLTEVSKGSAEQVADFMIDLVIKAISH